MLILSSFKKSISCLGEAECLFFDRAAIGLLVVD